jgi:beta-glucosidase-like glycosyl hydrolase
LAEDAEIQALADAAHRRALVLLRNDGNVLPLSAAPLRPTAIYVDI